MAPPRPFHPGSEELTALAEKYRALAALRARKDAADDGASKLALRALSQRHPGCLRELDTLGLPEIQRRAHACDAAAAGGPREPWMAWIAVFHRVMAAALALKRARASEDPAAAASRAAGLPLDAALVGDLLHPPGGRLTPAVLRFLGRCFDVPAAEISAALFPARRPPPYTLS